MSSVRQPRRTLARVALAAIAVVALAACGAPARVRTFDDEPDLVRVAGTTIPAGFGSTTTNELRRMLDACGAIDAKVATALPGVNHVTLTDAQCQWIAAAPELIVGILTNPGGDAMLDQTATVLKGERTVAGVGDRAVFDPQTRTLYVVKNGRLWYLQLVGSAPGVTAPTILTVLGRALVQTVAATR
jgi:hypothetical protein